MSIIKDAVNAMQAVLLLTDKVEKAGGVLTDVAKELREHDRRLIRLETMLEMAQQNRAQYQITPKKS